MAIVDSTSAFNGILRVWKIAGIIPHERFKKVFVVYSILIHIVIYIFFPYSVIRKLFEAENIQEVMQNLSVVIGGSAVSLKQFTLIFAREDIEDIVKVINKLDKSVKTQEEKDCIENSVNICKKIFFLYVCLCHVLASSYIITNLFGNSLIIPAWFPFDETETWNFWFAIAYQAVTILFLCLILTAHDTFSLIFLILLTSQFELIAFKVRAIGQKPLIELTDEKPIEECDDQPLDNYNQLVTCMKYHIDVIQLFQIMKNMIERTITVEYLVIVICLCSELIHLLYFTETFADIIVSLGIFTVFVLQIFPICYCMNRLNDVQSQLSDTIYGCNWVDEDLKFRKAVLLFIQNTQQPLTISAAYVVPINLTTFLDVIQASFSFFTVLNELNK